MSALAALIASAFAIGVHTGHLAVVELTPRTPSVHRAPAPAPTPSPQGQTDIGAARRAHQCATEYPGATPEECEREQQDEANKHAAERGETAPYPVAPNAATEQAEQRERANRGFP